MDEPWLYHYDPETKQQSMEWWHSGSPDQKYSECKNLLKKSSLPFFGIKTESFSLIIFQRAKLSTRSITDLYWCKWRTLGWKNGAGSSPRGPCSCMTMPRLTGHLQPGRNWPTWASIALITHSNLRIWPRRTTNCSLTEKNGKVAIFRPTRSLLPWRPGWKDNRLNFFWVICKSQSNGLRCVLSFVGSMLNKFRFWSL